MKEEKKKKEMISDSKELPDGVKLHENGSLYKEVHIGGVDEPFKLFNTLKPQRLEGETHNEYKIRRLLQNKNKSKGTVFHNSKKLGTYIKEKK